jgi:hypothetical protein
MFKVSELHHGFPYPHMALEVEGIDALPRALLRLCELGYDLEPSLKALQEAVDQSRKRKVLEAAICDLAKPTEKVEK